MRMTMLVRSVVVFALAFTVGVAVPATGSAESRALPEQFVTVGEIRGDYVHLSGSAGSLAASAHGWWTYPEPTDLKAKVTVQLQANLAGTWTDVGPSGSEVIRPGTGGSGRRANARTLCVNAISTEWRSVVDVDIIGKLDAPNKLVTAVQRLDCGV